MSFLLAGDTRFSSLIDSNEEDDDESLSDILADNLDEDDDLDDLLFVTDKVKIKVEEAENFEENNGKIKG